MKPVRQAEPPTNLKCKCGGRWPWVVMEALFAGSALTALWLGAWMPGGIAIAAGVFVWIGDCLSNNRRAI